MREPRNKGATGHPSLSARRGKAFRLPGQEKQDPSKLCEAMGL